MIINKIQFSIIITLLIIFGIFFYTFNTKAEQKVDNIEISSNITRGYEIDKLLDYGIQSLQYSRNISILDYEYTTYEENMLQSIKEIREILQLDLYKYVENIDYKSDLLNSYRQTLVAYINFIKINRNQLQALQNQLQISSRTYREKIPTLENQFANTVRSYDISNLDNHTEIFIKTKQEAIIIETRLAVVSFILQRFDIAEQLLVEKIQYLDQHKEFIIKGLRCEWCM